MEKVLVNTQSPYEVIIGKELKDEALRVIPEDSGKAVLLWDEAIPSAYVAELGNAIEAMGKEVMAVSMEGGEGAKTIESFSKISRILVEFNLSRSDVIFGIGGGSVMDLAGFIASTYKRGIRLVQVPTTILAACDASVGGKNALDLGKVKNVIGTFYQPSMVLVDTRFFETLSDEVFSEGCAEVIKYAYLGDPEMVTMLEERPLTENRGDDAYVTEILKRCIDLKAKIVAQDEKDIGIRNILNFGHTLGHAIEAESGYDIHHGEAVAMGMVLVTRAAENKGVAEVGTLGRLISTLTDHGLEWRCPYNIHALIGFVIKDKKIRGNMINLVVPRRPGECVLEKLPIDKVRTWFTEE